MAMGSQISYLPTQAVTFVTYVLLTYLTRVLCQPLQMEAESFSCGTNNVQCERWGYDACLLRDGEHMCLPCSHEYLRTLCGKKEEVPGCNLYCLDLALEKEKEILQTEMEANCSRKTEDLETEMKKEIEKIKKERNTESNRVKDLENVKKALIVALLVVAALFCLVLVVWLCLSGWCCNTSRFNGKEISEIENPFMSSVTENDVNSTPDQTDDTTIKYVDEQLREENNETTYSDYTIIDVKCPGDDCAGYAKLNSVSPCDNNTCGKMAIRTNEHEMPQN